MPQYMPFLFKGTTAMRRLRSIEFETFPGAALDLRKSPPQMALGFFVNEDPDGYTAVVRKIEAPLNIVSAYKSVMFLDTLWEVSLPAVILAWEASRRQIPFEVREQVEDFIKLINPTWYRHVMNDPLPDLSEMVNALFKLGMPIDLAPFEEEIEHGTLEPGCGINIPGLQVCCVEPEIKKIVTPRGKIQIKKLLH